MFMAGLLVMVCIARSDGRHGCLHSVRNPGVELAKVCEAASSRGCVHRVLLSEKFGVGGQT